jgi:hypothetical protein
MARHGTHGDRLQDPLVRQIWDALQTCDFGQALLVRNLAAHQAASRAAAEPTSTSNAQIQSMILSILEADLWMRSQHHKPLETVAQYLRYRTEVDPEAPSYKTLHRIFGGWDETKRAARAVLGEDTNRHLMIQEGVSQTGARRRPWEEHECVAALAACIEANFGHRPTQKQYAVWLRERNTHMPNENSIRSKVGWYEGLDRAVALIKSSPSRFPLSARLYQLADELGPDDGLAEAV